LEWGVGPSFWAPVDDLGRGLDFEGQPEGGEGDGLDADALSEGQGRVTAAGRGGPRPRDVTGGGLDFRAPFCAPPAAEGEGRPTAAEFFWAKATAG
jgi:hypothetical protein